MSDSTRTFVLALLLLLLPLQGLGCGLIGAFGAPAEHAADTAEEPAVYASGALEQTSVRACVHIQHACCYHSAWALKNKPELASTFLHRVLWSRQDQLPRQWCAQPPEPPPRTS